VDLKTGEVHTDAVIDAWSRKQTWRHPETQAEPTWNERVLVVRSVAYQAGLRRRREQAVARLTENLVEAVATAGAGSQALPQPRHAGADGGTADCPGEGDGGRADGA
jgi:hypothetical protein